jgi:hypothetical protein
MGSSRIGFGLQAAAIPRNAFINPFNSRLASAAPERSSSPCGGVKIAQADRDHDLRFYFKE